MKTVFIYVRHRGFAVDSRPGGSADGRARTAGCRGAIRPRRRAGSWPDHLVGREPRGRRRPVHGGARTQRRRQVDAGQGRPGAGRTVGRIGYRARPACGPGWQGDRIPPTAAQLRCRAAGAGGRYRWPRLRRGALGGPAALGRQAVSGQASGQVSGGEQQRLLIAQALVRQPRLLMLDEPLDSLDLPSQTAVAALIARICREQKVTVMLVAHDVNPILAYLDCVAYIAAGSAVCGPPESVITSETLTALYRTPIEVLRASDGRLVVVGEPEPPARHADRHADAAAR